MPANPLKLKRMNTHYVVSLLINYLINHQFFHSTDKKCLKIQTVPTFEKLQTILGYLILRYPFFWEEVLPGDFYWQTTGNKLPIRCTTLLKIHTEKKDFLAFLTDCFALLTCQLTHQARTLTTWAFLDGLAFCTTPTKKLVLFNYLHQKSRWANYCKGTAGLFWFFKMSKASPQKN